MDSLKTGKYKARSVPSPEEKSKHNLIIMVIYKNSIRKKYYFIEHCIVLYTETAGFKAEGSILKVEIFKTIKHQSYP